MYPPYWFCPVKRVHIKVGTAFLLLCKAPVYRVRLDFTVAGSKEKVQKGRVNLIYWTLEQRVGTRKSKIRKSVCEIGLPQCHTPRKRPIPKFITSRRLQKATPRHDNINQRNNYKTIDISKE